MAAQYHPRHFEFHLTWNWLGSVSDLRGGRHLISCLVCGIIFGLLGRFGLEYAVAHDHDASLPLAPRAPLESSGSEYRPLRALTTSARAPWTVMNGLSIRTAASAVHRKAPAPAPCVRPAARIDA